MTIKDDGIDPADKRQLEDEAAYLESMNGEGDDFTFGEEGFDIGSMSDAGSSNLMGVGEDELAKKRASNRTAADLHRQSISEACADNDDLVHRAKALVELSAIQYKHFDPPKKGYEDVQTATRTSTLNRHAVYDALFDYGSGAVVFPHYDTFKGRLVDHEGETFNKNIRTRELLLAMDAAGMKNPTDRDITESLRSWALDHKLDSLAETFKRKMPEWDGKSRMETKLIELFQPKDTDLNRLFGKYFWLSLYMRLTHAGSLAPITLSLIGGQDAGKSYFSVLLVRTLMDDKSAAPVTLNLGAHDYNKFLREITGHSIVANVGEMAGFQKGDMERIKAFMTATSDDLDFKFEDSISKPRQWIVVMDSNRYEGMQRDETGNRRFYPMFVGQLADKDGQPDWKKQYSADFTNFAEDTWQLMAEAQSWVEENGEQGYMDLVKTAVSAVAQFNEGEMAEARGTIKSDLITDWLGSVLCCVDWGDDYAHIKDGKRYKAWHVKTGTINAMFEKLCNRQRVFPKALASPMTKLGFEPKLKGFRGYQFSTPDHNMTEHDLKRHIIKTLDPLLGDEEVDQLIDNAMDLNSSSGGGKF